MSKSIMPLDKIKARKREKKWRENNWDKVLKYSRKWKKDNPKKVKEMTKKYLSNPKTKERMKKYSIEYNQRPEVIERNKKDRNFRRKRIKDFILDYKKDKCCANPKCNYNEHTEILQFHHKDPKKKEINISILVRARVKPETALKEIKKCILLCSNCHDWLHYKENSKLAQR